MLIGFFYSIFLLIRCHHTRRLSVNWKNLDGTFVIFVKLRKEEGDRKRLLILDRFLCKFLELKLNLPANLDAKLFFVRRCQDIDRDTSRLLFSGSIIYTVRSFLNFAPETLSLALLFSLLLELFQIGSIRYS